MKQITLLFAASVLCLSQAAKANDSGAYFAAGIATDGAMNACVKPTTAANCNYYTTYSTHGNLHVLGGYNFNKFVGIEAGYSKLGTYNVTDTVGAYVGTVDPTAFTLAARGGYKFNFGLSLFGKLGLAEVWNRYKPTAGWVATNASNNQQSTGLMLGLGVQYDFDDEVGIRLSREVVSFNDAAYKGAVATSSLLVVLNF